MQRLSASRTALEIGQEPHVRQPDPASPPSTRPQPQEVRLTLVIPALNEEEAIARTIERCLAARKEIREKTGIAGVRVVVVSDGSSDRTAEIAGSYAEVETIVFPQNRGYGAAIKEGWERGGGDLLGFLDADGTCDPAFFVPLCESILAGGQDIAIGCRMGPGSRMPRIRRFGNTLFALLLGFLSKRTVRDSASGMRVVRATVLPRLLPLPDGLHFTPAMSAVALMDGDVRIAEIDMPYEERVGESKLHVMRDGFRFLGSILSAVAYLKVSRLTVPIMALLAGISAILMLGPIAFYLANHRLEEWMFYRFAFVGMIGTIAVTLLCTTVVVEHVVALTHLRYERFRRGTRGFWRYEIMKPLALAGCALWFAAALLNLGGLIQLLSTGHVTVHWSRVLVGAFFSVNLAQLLCAVAALKIVRALNQRQPFLHGRTGRDAP